MDKLALVVLGMLGVGVLLLVGSLVGAFFGMIGGWIVGWAFDETMQKLLVNVLGLKDVVMWELGAMMGFVGGFIRSSTSSSS